MKTKYPATNSMFMNTPLQKFRILKGKELIHFFMDRFDYTADEAIRMEARMPGGYKVQVI